MDTLLAIIIADNYMFWKKIRIYWPSDSIRTEKQVAYLKHFEFVIFSQIHY